MAHGRHLRIFLVVAVVAAFAALAVYVHDTNAAPPPAMPQMPPPQVKVQVIAPADLPLTYEYAGRNAGSREIEVRARVSGILLKRAYVEGQPVKAGDLLFQIDPAPFQATFAQAQAKFVQAEQDWKRVQQLNKEKAVSAREFDDAKSTYEQAKAEVKTAQINLGYTTVTAPISGVTSEEGLSEGSLVTADTSLLTRISQMDPMYVNFALPDSELLNQRKHVADGSWSAPEGGKLTAEIHFEDGSKYSQTGTVDFTDSIINAQTGTVNARAVVPNPDSVLLPGQFVRVRLAGILQKNAIAVPDQAVMQGPPGTFVYVVDAENKVGIKPVQLGILNGTMRLIDGGLATGDKVITDGMIKVRPGAPVAIASDAPAAQPGAAASMQAPPPAADAKDAKPEKAAGPSDEKAPVVKVTHESKDQDKDVTEKPAAAPQTLKGEGK